MNEVGDILTVNCQVFRIDGKITFEIGDKVTIRGFLKEPAHYSKLCPDIWILEKLMAIKLVEERGLWKPEMFEEFKLKKL